MLGDTFIVKPTPGSGHNRLEIGLKHVDTTSSRARSLRSILGHLLYGRVRTAVALRNATGRGRTPPPHARGALYPF